MKRKIALGALITVFLALATIYFINAPGFRKIVYPSPNAYDTLTEASEKMTPLPLDFDTSQDIEALRTYLEANLDPLLLIDQAMDQQCLIRMPDMQTMEEMHDHSSFARAPMRLMYVNARVAELEGRSADAADALVKIAVIGRRSGRGGLMIHQLISVAIEQQGLAGLAQIALKLSSDERGHLAKLIRAEDKNESDLDTTIESILYRERDMTKREYGTFAGLFMIWQLSGSDMTQVPEQIMRDEMTKVQEQRADLLEILDQTE